MDGVFEHIHEKIRVLARDGGEKKLSSAGREVLIKSVAQAVPTYSMSCFKLSAGLCKKICSLFGKVLAEW